jgi:DamX protein
MSQGIDQDAPEALVTMSRQSAVTFNPSVNPENFSDPFSDSSTTAFFSGGDKRLLLDEVIHLCQFGNNLVAVLGDEGVGRTTFLSQARYELAETAFCCFINGSVMMSAEDIFTQIISQLELPVGPSSSAGEMIATLRHSMAEGNLHRVVIIIDDAHHLNDQILSALVSLLQGHQGNHLHILVGGDKSIAQRFDQFEMVDVLVYDVTLNPLSEEEVREYLDFKLSASGYQSASHLSDSQIKSLWAETQGYPAAVNRAAQTLLFQQDFGADDEVRPTGLPLLHMSLLVLLLAALIMALFYVGGGDEADTQEALPEVKVLSQQGDGQPEAAVVAIEPAQNAQQESNTVEQAAPSSEESAPSISGGQGQQTPAVPQAPGDNVVDNRSSSSKEQSQAVSNSVEESSSPTKESSAVAESNAPSNSSEPPAVSAPSTSPALAPVTTVTAEQAKKTLQEELKKEAVSLGNNNASAPKPVSPSSQSLPSSQSSTNFTVDEEVVLNWPDQAFTLQVMAAAQEQGLKQFISRQPNKDSLRLVTVSRDNKPWYVVLVGVYDNGNLARQTIQSLPQAQVNAGPWPRKIGDIKQQIMSFRGK